MRALIQRVSRAAVAIDGETPVSTGRGMLVFVCFEPGDETSTIDRMVERLLNYRIFPDERGRMNRSLRDIDGDWLIVPQFTLAADTRKGNRPSFSNAAAPELSERCFHYLIDRARQAHGRVGSGRFGANMQVSLINDGPITLLLSL